MVWKTRVQSNIAVAVLTLGEIVLKIVITLAVTLLALSGAVNAALAQKYLTGELSGNYPAGEYIVSGNIHVLPKTTLTLDPGCILRFENYTGIVVRGELICKGTSLKPIVFSSSRDVPSTRTMPEAFDWNGIKVTSESDGITLENCVISYSTFGMNIESNGTPVLIKEIKFNNNGSASLTREKRMMPVTENMGISFIWPEVQQAKVESDSAVSDTSPKVLPTKKTKKNEKIPAKKVQSKKEYAKPKGAWIQPVRITFGSAAAVGGIMWLSGYLQSGKYKNQRDGGVYIPRTPDWYSADKNYRNWGTIQNLGIGLFSVGALGFTVTFLF